MTGSPSTEWSSGRCGSRVISSCIAKLRLPPGLWPLEQLLFRRTVLEYSRRRRGEKPNGDYASGWAVNAALWLLWVAPFALVASAAEGDGATWAQTALDRALSASSDIHDPFHRAQSLAEIAETRAALGQRTVAMSLLQLAAESADQIDNPALASWARHDIAVAYVRAGDVGHAEAVAETVSDFQLRDAVLVVAADARRSAQDLSGALFTAWRIRDEVRQGEALRRIVIAQASARQMQDALATARSIAHPVFAGVALGDVATAYAREGSMGEARKHALRIRDTRVRSEVQAELASLQAEMGDVSDAAAATKSIEDRL